MKLTWLGHSGFRMEIGDQVLLIDPWLTGNPVLPEGAHDAAIKGATAIVLSHGHGDHAGDALGLSKDLDVPIVGIYDLMSYWEDTEGANVIGFNKGGTVTLGSVSITMVAAVHSSSMRVDGKLTYAGAEAGYMIEAGGRTVYFSGDTDVTADMGVWNDLHSPEMGILCAGGHFTMDMKRASYAAKTFFDFKTVVPCHYKTFPLLEQSADAMKAALPGVDVVEMDVMVPREF